MSEELLYKTNTGIASRFLVVEELAGRGYNVTLTLGNTKAIDLLLNEYYSWPFACFNSRGRLWQGRSAAGT